MPVEKGLGEADGEPALMDLRAFKYLKVNKTQAGAVGVSRVPVSILLISLSWALLFLSRWRMSLASFSSSILYPGVSTYPGLNHISQSMEVLIPVTCEGELIWK